MEAYTLTKTKQELQEIMNEAGIPFGLIATVAEAAEHPQLQTREMLVEVDDPALGTIKIPGIPIKMHDTPGVVKRHRCWVRIPMKCSTN